MSWCASSTPFGENLLEVRCFWSAHSHANVLVRMYILGSTILAKKVTAMSGVCMWEVQEWLFPFHLLFFSASAGGLLLPCLDAVNFPLLFLCFSIYYPEANRNIFLDWIKSISFSSLLISFLIRLCHSLNASYSLFNHFPGDFFRWGKKDGGTGLILMVWAKIRQSLLPVSCVLPEVDRIYFRPGGSKERAWNLGT